MEEGLGSGDIVVDGDPAPPQKRGIAAPTFQPMSVVAKRSPISATAELLSFLLLFGRIAVYYVDAFPIFYRWSSVVCRSVYLSRS